MYMKILSITCPGNVFPGNVLSGKVIVQERSCPGNDLSGKCLVWESDCPGNVCKAILSEMAAELLDNTEL